MHSSKKERSTSAVIHRLPLNIAQEDCEVLKVKLWLALHFEHRDELEFNPFCTASIQRKVKN